VSASSKELLIWRHISMSSWHPSFNTSFAGSPIAMSQILHISNKFYANIIYRKVLLDAPPSLTL